MALRRSTSPGDVERDVEVLLRLRHARRGGGLDAAAEQFLHAYAASLARHDLLRLSVIDVDGAPAGVLLGWRLGARAFAYSHTFDRAHERFGVGMALLAHAVREAAAEGCTRFDLMRGDEQYKSSVHISPDRVTSYRAVRRRPLARLDAKAFVATRSAYQRLSPQRRARLRRALRIGRTA